MHSVNRSTTVAICGLCYLRKAVPKLPTHHKALTSSRIDNFNHRFYRHPAMSPLQKTRFLIISDTHNADRNRQDFSWEPFPKVDVVLHCGDLTMLGRMQEYQTTFDMIKDIDAELKLVIAGNHDISLDPPFYKRRGWLMQRGGYSEELPHKARALWCGSAAKEAGIFYLDEGVHSFTLKSGANLKVTFYPRNMLCSSNTSRFMHRRTNQSSVIGLFPTITIKIDSILAVLFQRAMCRSQKIRSLAFLMFMLS